MIPWRGEKRPDRSRSEEIGDVWPSLIIVAFGLAWIVLTTGRLGLLNLVLFPVMTASIVVWGRILASLTSLGREASFPMVILLGTAFNGTVISLVRWFVGWPIIPVFLLTLLVGVTLGIVADRRWTGTTHRTGVLATFLSFASATAWLQHYFPPTIRDGQEVVVRPIRDVFIHSQQVTLLAYPGEMSELGRYGLAVSPSHSTTTRATYSQRSSMDSGRYPHSIRSWGFGFPSACDGRAGSIRLGRKLVWSAGRHLVSGRRGRPARSHLLDRGHGDDRHLDLLSASFLTVCRRQCLRDRCSGCVTRAALGGLSGSFGGHGRNRSLARGIVPVFQGTDFHGGVSTDLAGSCGHHCRPMGKPNRTSLHDAGGNRGRLHRRGFDAPSVDPSSLDSFGTTDARDSLGMAPGIPIGGSSYLSEPWMIRRQRHWPVEVLPWMGWAGLLFDCF